MGIVEKRDDDETVIWQACLECGNRYRADTHGYGVNWCSTRCEHAALRRQRDQIETTWIRAIWFLR